MPHLGYVKFEDLFHVEWKAVEGNVKSDVIRNENNEDPPDWQRRKH